jgi:hypothetical protein
MAALKEPHVCIKFCCKLGKNARETLKMLHIAFGEQTMGRTCFELFSEFRSDVASDEDVKH